MTSLVVINGGAGGGQMLRNAVALSAVSGRPVRVENIRGARPQPGLRPQHLMGVRAAAGICGAKLSGAEIGSREIELWPGEVRPRAGWRMDVGTAGSLTLVLQCLLPALARAQAVSNLTLVGGTDVPFAPPFDYFREVFVPALAELGPRVEARCEARGFYPKGGGEVEVRVKPSASIRPIAWTERGPVARLQGRAYSVGLPGHIAKRIRESALKTLADGGYQEADIALEVKELGRSEGCGIVLWAECEGGRRLGAGTLGRRGKRAERVGEEAAQNLLGELAPGAATDSHLADQLVVWMSLAEGPSELTTTRVTDHLRSAVEVAEAIVGTRFSVQEEGLIRVQCAPAG